MQTDLLNDLLNGLRTQDLETGKTTTFEDAGEEYLKYLNSKYDMTEMKGIMLSKGNLEIVSCAGSGKTTSFMHKVHYDWITNTFGNDPELSKVWICTFLNKGAKDLEDKIGEITTDYSNYARKNNLKYTACSPKHITTIHRELMNIISEVDNITEFKIIDDDLNDKLLAEVLKEEGMGYQGRSEKSNLVNDLKTAFSVTRNRLGDARYDYPLYNSLKLTPKRIEKILYCWKEKRKELHQIDFEDIQEKVYEECKALDERYLNAIHGRYDFIFIDEFQDTSQIQYEIIKEFAKEAKKILVIGDDDQTIYTWRGSCGDIIVKDFIHDFKPQVLSLSVNHRCPANILNPIVPSIERNQNRLEKSIRASKEGGKFEERACNDYMEMGRVLREGILNDLKEYTGKKIAILCRVNTDAFYPILLLAQAGIPFSISKDKMLLNKKLDSYVFGIMDMVAGFISDKTVSVLKLYCPKESAMAENIVSICKNNNQSIWDFDPDELRNSDSILYHKIADWVSDRKRLDNVDLLVKIYTDYIEMLTKEDKPISQYNETIKAVFYAVIDYILESDTDEINYLKTYLVDLFKKLNRHIKPKDKKSNEPIDIATVHEYKGAQAEVVYIWNDTQKMFPHQKGGEKITLEQIEEERRIHYIACTRGQEKSTILTIGGYRGQFLKEMKIDRPKPQPRTL